MRNPSTKQLAKKYFLLHLMMYAAGPAISIYGTFTVLDFKIRHAADACVWMGVALFGLAYSLKILLKDFTAIEEREKLGNNE